MRPFSKPCLDRNMHTYVMTKELKRMVFRINIQNIKRAIDIQVTLILKIKLEKYIF